MVVPQVPPDPATVPSGQTQAPAAVQTVPLVQLHPVPPQLLLMVGSPTVPSGQMQAPEEVQMVPAGQSHVVPPQLPLASTGVPSGQTQAPRAAQS